MPVAATNLRPERLDAGLGQILGRVHASERRQELAVSVDPERPRALGDQPEPALAGREQLLDEREQREPVDRAQRLVASFAPDHHDRIAIGIEGRCQSADRLRREERHVGAADERRLGSLADRAHPGRDALERPLIGDGIACDLDAVGQRGNSWPGAPTTTTGAAAAATTRATWTTSGDPSQSRSAFGSPIRVDPPPASTIPPSRSAPVSVSRLERAAARASSRRSPARPRPRRPGRSALPTTGARAAAARTGRAARGGGASGMAGAAGRVIPIRRQAREDGMRWGLAPEGWGVLGSATVTLSTRTRQAVPGFPTGPTSQCAPKLCLGVRSLHSLPAISTGSPQAAYPAVSRASSASASTWAAATQSSSEADSAGVWLAPVGLRTNSIAAGT